MKVTMAIGLFGDFTHLFMYFCYISYNCTLYYRQLVVEFVIFMIDCKEEIWLSLKDLELNQGIILSSLLEITVLAGIKSRSQM